MASGFKGNQLVTTKQQDFVQEYALGGDICLCVAHKWYKGYGGPAGSFTECSNMVIVTKTKDGLNGTDSRGLILEIHDDAENLCGVVTQEQRYEEP